MIIVTRLPEPRALQRNGANWLRILNEVMDNPRSTKGQKDNAENKYRHEEIKSTLTQMFQSKCAYCESKIIHITYGDIEHFRPRHRFRELTFIWTNLLLSCNICNDQGHKGHNFPEYEDGNPVLIDPSDPTENIDRHLGFLWDDLTKISLVTGKDTRGHEVINTFDLNGSRGRTELIRHRSQQMEKIVALALYALEGNQRALDLLTEACQPNAEYSASTRAICQHFGIPV